MAAAPPPFTSGPSGPGNPDPRWQWKQQRRAAKDQWRAQRAYYRGMRRPSIVRPVVLILIGVVALMIEAGTISGYEFWDWYIRWWPLLLIGLGLALLGEWWLQQGDPYSRRTGVGGLVFLIVLVALLGVVGKHAMNSPFGWHFSDEDNTNWGMHLFGQEHDADRQFDQAFGANGRLTIENPHGDVSIAPSTDDRSDSSSDTNGGSARRRTGRHGPTGAGPGANPGERPNDIVRYQRRLLWLTTRVRQRALGRRRRANSGVNARQTISSSLRSLSRSPISTACAAHIDSDSSTSSPLR